jgi:hypothetical protein
MGCRDQTDIISVSYLVVCGSNSGAVMAILIFPQSRKEKSKILSHYRLPIPVAMRSEAWVCGRWFAGIAGSNPDGGMDVRRECSQVEVCASGWSVVQRSPTECLCHHNLSPLCSQWVCRRVQTNKDRLLLLPSTPFQIIFIGYSSIRL